MFRPNKLAWTLLIIRNRLMFLMIAPDSYAKFRYPHQGHDLPTFLCLSTTTGTNRLDMAFRKSSENSQTRMNQSAFWDTRPKVRCIIKIFRRDSLGKIYWKFKVIGLFYIISKRILWPPLRKSVGTIRILLFIILCICTSWIRMSRLKN